MGLPSAESQKGRLFGLSVHQCLRLFWTPQQELDWLNGHGHAQSPGLVSV